MKGIIRHLLNEKKVILSFMLGVIIMGGVSYAVGSLSSESVSYTRGSETMSVKQALDDLIVKVDKKSGNFNIELAERTIGVNLTENTATYKSIVDTVLGKMITDMGKDINATELTALKNSTLTWTSEDPNIASVTSNTTVKGIKVGTTKVIGTATNGKQVIVPVNVKSASYLADQVQIGDYVAYDAGTWGSTVAQPSSSYKFGGYKSGQSKNLTVSCSSLSVTLNGWRVLSIDKSSKKVTIVHAGHPECYYHGSDSSESKSKLNEHANEYKNSYAESGRSINKTDVDAIASDNTLRKIGDYYFLATEYSTYDLYRVSHLGEYYTFGSSKGMDGYRPVIVLKSSVLTTGRGKDQVGNENAWILTQS